MELPRELEPIQADEQHSAHLELIQGGFAVEETVEVSPVDIRLPFDDFKVALHGLIHDEVTDKTPEQKQEVIDSLKDVRDAILDETHDLAFFIHELQQEHDALLQKSRWVSGYLRDRL